jgi:NAD-dependent SIR2 family protein deacetylase
MTTNNIIQLAAQAIRAAETLFITAGAGMGVDSGLPDFRGNQGFWKMHPAYAKAELTFADLADPQWFTTHPHRAWGFYGYRYHLYQATLPHEGFAILKKWQDNTPNPGFVYTSNVDGHFQKAGFRPKHVYECHGSINHLQCNANCSDKIWSAPNLNIEIDPDNLLATSTLPSCPDCGSVARPNILMFGDWDWLSRRADQQRQHYYQWKLAVAKTRIVVIEVGAGCSVGAVRFMGQALGGTLIRINTREAEGATISIAMPALTALRAIDDVLISQTSA